MNENKILGGWSGGTKLSLVIVVLMISMTMEINSLLAQGNHESKRNDAIEGITLPRWENSYKSIEIDNSNTIELALLQRKVYLNGTQVSLASMSSWLRDSQGLENKVVLAKIDINENLSLLEYIFFEFRRHNVRKFIFQGMSLKGNEPSFLMMNLAPRKNFEKENLYENDIAPTDHYFLWVDTLVDLETIVGNDYPFFAIKGSTTNRPNYAVDQWLIKTDSLIKQGSIVKMNPNRTLSGNLKSDLTDFIQDNVSAGRYKCVIQHYFWQNEMFQEFISNLNSVRLSYLNAYDKLAQDMYGKPYDELEQTESLIIREKVPMAVMIHGGVDWTFDVGAKKLD